MDNKYKKLGKNTILVFIGRAGSSLISLIMLPLYTSWLSTDEYGTVDLMTTYASVLISIVSCCVADAIFIFPKDETEENKKSYFSSGLLFVFLMAISFVCFNFCVSILYKEGSFLYSFSWQTLALTLCMFVQNYAQQFTRCLERMKVYATTGIVHTFCVAGLAILLIPKLGLSGYILSLILANLFSAIYSFVLSKSYYYFSFSSFSSRHLRTLLIYGIPLIPNSIMWWLVNGVNRPIMEKYMGLSAIGIYAVASRFPGIVSTIAGVFSNAWGISMLDEFGKPGFEAFFNKTFKLITFISVFSSFFLIVFSEQVIRLFSTDAYYYAAHLLPLMLIGTVINISTGLIGGVFMALKKSKYFFYSSAASAITSVVFTYVLISHFGLIGCTIAASLSFLVAFILRYFFAKNYIKGFSLAYYAFSILLLLVTTFIYESSLSVLVKAALYLFIAALIISINKSIIKALLGFILRK